MTPIHLADLTGAVLRELGMAPEIPDVHAKPALAAALVVTRRPRTLDLRPVLVTDFYPNHKETAA